MRCHFIWDEVSGKKVLIPGCYGSMYGDDLSNCCCPKPVKSAKRFEKEEYNKRVKELEAELQHLQKEYNALLRIIEKSKTK